MQNDVNKGRNEPEVEVTSQFSEALAAYFEQRNSGANLVELAKGADDELKPALALVQLNDKAAQDRADVNKAWQAFKTRAFSPAATPVSLGSYVNETLASGEVIKASGLPRETLEALRQDETPLAELKDFELADYAALAKRYGVKENLFPRMLKWLKGLGKSFAAPSFGSAPQRAMLFAREDGYQYQADEEFISEELKRAEPEPKAAEGETSQEE